MKVEDVVHLIQHYRHDVLNQLQIVQGYIKLNDLKKADSSMDELLQYFDQERKLLSLNIPNVFLWFLQFKIKYNHFSLTYDIDIESKDLQKSDHFIVRKFEQMMQEIQQNYCEETLHQVEVELKDNIEFCDIAIYIDEELEKNDGKYESRLEDIDSNMENNKRIYHFQVPINDEVN